MVRISTFDRQIKQDIFQIIIIWLLISILLIFNWWNEYYKWNSAIWRNGNNRQKCIFNISRLLDHKAVLHLIKSKFQSPIKFRYFIIIQNVHSKFVGMNIYFYIYVNWSKIIHRYEIK